MKNFPLGVRRDGSYYTRIEWASHTESDPTFWVVNLIRDDLERNGGTWGANTKGPASVVVSFLGETQKISKIRLFRNVGLDVSIIEELASSVDFYISNTDEPRKLRRKEDKIDDVKWKLIKHVEIEKGEGWQEIILNETVEARYVRMDLLENFGTPIPWIEMSELKLYP